MRGVMWRGRRLTRLCSAAAWTPAALTTARVRKAPRVVSTCQSPFSREKPVTSVSKENWTPFCAAFSPRA